MNQNRVSIKELYPELSEAELTKAEDNLEQYLALVLRILDRVVAETYPQPERLISGTGTIRSSSPSRSAIFN